MDKDIIPIIIIIVFVLVLNLLVNIKKNTIKLIIVALLDGIPYVFDFTGLDCLIILLNIFDINCANNIPDKNNTALCSFIYTKFRYK